jgi:hypothetical protein
MAGDDDHFPETPTASGWYPVKDGTDQETFWDGTAWTRRRQYRFGSPFLEIPLHRGDPPLASTPNAPDPTTPASSTPSSSPTSQRSTNMGGPRPTNRTIPERTARQPTSDSPILRTSRQRVRILLLIYLIATIGFFVSATRGGPSSSTNPEKYFVFLLFFGILIHVFVYGATLSARREVRSQEGDRRPKWPFRYVSRLTEGLQGQRLMSFVGGMRMQPRLGPPSFNASVPFARLSVFTNGVRLGPSSSLLSLQVPTWEARFDELDVIQAIGRVKGVTTGVLFRKSQSREWVIFWTGNREQVFATFEHMGVTVSHEPIRLRFGTEWRVNQFDEDEIRPSVPSVLGAATATTTANVPIASPSDSSSPLVFAAPLSSNASDGTTTAPEDRRWPGAVVAALMTIFVVSIFSLVLHLVTIPGSPKDGGVVTTSTSVSVANSPAAWRTSAESHARNLRPAMALMTHAISYLHDGFTVTEDNEDLVALTTTIQGLGCETFYLLSKDAPTPALAQDVANVANACGDLVDGDQADLRSSDNKWTPKLASNDAHWLDMLKDRVAVLENAAAN